MQIHLLALIVTYIFILLHFMAIFSFSKPFWLSWLVGLLPKHVSRLCRSIKITLLLTFKAGSEWKVLAGGPNCLSAGLPAGDFKNKTRTATKCGLGLGAKLGNNACNKGNFSWVIQSWVGYLLVTIFQTKFYLKTRYRPYEYLDRPIRFVLRQ